jgi:hypothetical protein
VPRRPVSDGALWHGHRGEPRVYGFSYSFARLDNSTQTESLLLICINSVGIFQRQMEKSAIGDIRECQRSATSKSGVGFQRERRFVVTVLSQNSKASPLMRSVFGRMLGYGDVIVRGTLRNDRVVCHKRKPAGCGMLLERKAHSPIRLILKPTNTLILSKS